MVTLEELKKTKFKDEYDLHWAIITTQAKIGDKRICPNCGGVMKLEDDPFEHWNCNTCYRMEYLCTQEDEEPIKDYYWCIDDSVQETNNKPKVKFWQN